MPSGAGSGMLRLMNRMASSREGLHASGGPPAKDAVSFGPFRLSPSARLLEKDDVPLQIGGRALDLLIALVERAGEVVSKADLFARVWVDVTVDEGSLRFHIAALRKVLGDGKSGARYIVNAPGRGYSFVAPITRSAAQPALSSAPATALPPTLPTQLTRMVGRADTILRLSDELSQHRFVTVVGPGGIGKTTVAVTVAHAQIAAFNGAIFFMDFGALRDPALVASALASALGLMVSSEDPVPGLLAFLQERRMLLILDSCEHVVESLASLAESIFKAAPQVHLLATSRESLRVEGEHIHRLFPLEVPPLNAGMTAADILAFPAVQLFVERVAASAGGFELTDADAPVVAEICQKLDGIALALELAAGRVGAYGIQGTATLLNSRLALLWQGRRTAVPRHQTLGAALGWSYDLLSQTEAMALRRLSVFAGPFTLEASLSVAASADMAQPDIIEALAGLAAKSLVAVDHASTMVRYRLLDATRAYVQVKLAESGEGDAAARRHAVYFTDLLTRIEHEEPDDYPGCAEHLPNVRAALEWSFSADGDATLATALAAVATQLFLELSLLTECYRWAERAMPALDASAIDTRQELHLQASLAVSAMFTQGSTEQVRTAFVRGIDLARSLADPHYEIRLLRGFHIYLTRIGDYRSALDVSGRAVAVATILGDPVDRLTADWMLGVAQHLSGNQAEAIVHCESALSASLPARHRNVLRLGYDDRIIALVALARALWLAGAPDRAVEAARFTISEAERLDQPVTLGIALIWMTYVFLWCGDWAGAGQLIERLIAHAAKHSLGPYNAVGLGLKGDLLVRQGEPSDGVELLRRGLATLHATRHKILVGAFSIALAEGLAQTGQTDDALTVLDAAIQQVVHADETFDLPELLRLKAALLRVPPRADIAGSDACFRQSLELARRQSALGWELRTAMSLARILAESGRAIEARDLLQPVYEQFTEGHATADLQTAKAFLSALNAYAAGG
jgi:predicted ATPase/DNA-binding winged helix-turn-helix (wHTH) protein